MNDIADMYQDLIIDHSRSPKNFGKLEKKSHHARGHNPLCGDTIHLDLLLDDEKVLGVAFDGDGCAISKASASLMTESIKGKSLDTVEELFQKFVAMLTCDGESNGLGKLMVLQGVKQFPIRVKCATLCWHTLNAALKQKNQSVTTE